MPTKPTKKKKRTSLTTRGHTNGSPRFLGEIRIGVYQPPLKKGQGKSMPRISIYPTQRKKKGANL